MFKKNNRPKYTIINGVQDGLEFIGHYNKKLINYKNKSEYPYFLGISIQGFTTDERMLPRKDDRQEIDKFEDEIIKRIDLITDNIYAGHSFWGGALETVFYINKYEDVISDLESLDQTKLKYTFSFKVEHDPEWVYLNELIR